MERLAELLRQGADRIVNLPTEAQRFITNPQAFTQLLTGKNPLPRETGFAAGATGLPAQQGTILNPEYQAYMQGYEQGEPVSIAAMATPAAIPLAKALAPKAGQMAEQYMVNQGFMPSLIAYHGTPHTIKGKFDISKVGTGEGAQSYGHGMYFAEEPKVAKMYQAALSNTKYKVGERELKGNEAWAAQFLHDFQGDALPKRIDVDTAISKANQTLKDTATKQEIINNIKALDKAGLTVESGNLYKVDIPDEYIPKMINWDTPFAQQPEDLRNLFAKVNPIAVLQKDPSNEFTRWLRLKDTAQELQDLGYKGIRYLDEGSRIAPRYTGDMAFIHAGNSFKEGGYSLNDALAGMKQAYKNASEKELKDALGEVYGVKPNQTSNFVVFEPSDVKILEQNNKPMTRKELIQKQVDNLK